MFVHNSSIGRVSNSGVELDVPMTCFSSRETPKGYASYPSNKVQDSMLESINDCTGQSQTGRLFRQAMAGAKPVDSSSLVELEPKRACAHALLCQRLLI